LINNCPKLSQQKITPLPTSHPAHASHAFHSIRIPSPFLIQSNPKNFFFLTAAGSFVRLSCLSFQKAVRGPGEACMPPMA
jgi:hypothetical protein